VRQEKTARRRLVGGMIGKTALLFGRGQACFAIGNGGKVLFVPAPQQSCVPMDSNLVFCGCGRRRNHLRHNSVPVVIVYINQVRCQGEM
jgi:hypothetical protein